MPTSKKLKDFVHWYKKTASCADCGWVGHPACLDFDHVPSRGIKIDVIKRFIIDRDEIGLWKEISKCDVVCARCHRLRTIERGLSSEAREKLKRAVTGKKKNSRWPQSETHPMTREKRENIGAKQRGVLDGSNPEHSIRMKLKWQDPAFRERMVACQRGVRRKTSV